MQGLANDFLVFDAPAGLAGATHRSPPDACAGRSTHRRRLRSGTHARSAARPGQSRVLPDLQRRRRRGGAMRQRRTMRRRAPVCPCSATRPRARDGEQGGAGACVRTAGRVGVGGHGGTRRSLRRRFRSMPRPNGRAIPSRSAGRASSSARSRSATRTQCCASTTSRQRPSRGSVPPSSAIRAFPSVPTWASCKSSGAGHIALRVFERGVGETLACGTGACAAVAVGRRQGLLAPDVRVDLPGGTAEVSWGGGGEHAWLTGPAITVFSGIVDI